MTADSFVSATALANPTQGWNRYAYVEADPVNFWDPAGLCAALAGAEACFLLTVYRLVPGVGPGGGRFHIREPGPLQMVPAFWACEFDGGGPGTVPVGAVTNSLARSLLAKRLDGLEQTNCDRVLAEVLGRRGSPTAPIGCAKPPNDDLLTYYNVREPAYANLTQHRVAGNDNLTTLNNSLPSGWSVGTIRGALGAAVLFSND